MTDQCSRCHGAKGGVPGNENVIDGKPVCDYCHAEELLALPAKPVTEWFALKDRKPTYSDGHPVLAYTGHTKWPPAEFVVWNYDYDDEQYLWSEVSHWRPLPEAPTP